MDPYNFAIYHVENVYLQKKHETFIEIKMSLENYGNEGSNYLFFFQFLLVPIPKRKCLVGASRIRSRESGTPSTISLYTRKQAAY